MTDIKATTRIRIVPELSEPGSDTVNLTQLANELLENLGLSGLRGRAVSATIGLAAGAENVMTVTAQVVDGAGAAVSGVHALDLWFSESATGAGLTADTYSGTLVATTGALLTTLTAKKHFSVVTNSAGLFVGSLTDTAKPADQYVAVKAPIGAGVVVSAASGTSWGAA